VSVAAYREPVSRIIAAATADDFGWQRLAELTDSFGSRLSGSDGLTHAIAWSVDRMKKDGLDNVRTEPVMVPHWVRGVERGEILGTPPQKLDVLGLGGTVPTPAGGLEGGCWWSARSTSCAPARPRSRDGSCCSTSLT
jgi:carboxypeptidase Q